MASACSGLFGLPITLNWFQACYTSRRPVSSALFEPTAHERDTSHWLISKGYTASPKPDFRPMIVCVMQEEGMSLEQCASAEDLCESVLHALLGWLSAYERGWLQRDPSIGNILRLREDRVQSWEDSENLASQLQSLEHALNGFGRPQVCKAILTDFDLSAHLQNYFSVDHSDARTLSGTVEFMSIRLREAFTGSKPYLQSPLDDLWAFFYTVVWATVFHAHRPSTEVLPISDEELKWRLHLRSRSVDEREGTIKSILRVKVFQQQFPPMLLSMVPILKDWISALEEMEDAWVHREHEASATGGIGLSDFNHLAYTGVLDFIHVFADHRERLARNHRELTEEGDD
ncbi:hypothetical protein B0H12DRAFT_1144545 [Mycena haematopus]|nr:hypothetical protein B0H12DRAFT_1144545 [Mycena haematopus]